MAIAFQLLPAGAEWANQAMAITYCFLRACAPQLFDDGPKPFLGPRDILRAHLQRPWCRFHPTVN